MSHANERRSRRGIVSKSTLGYWVPLGLTIVAATLTLAAWVWSEQRETEDGYDDESGSSRARDEDTDRVAQGQGYSDSQFPDEETARGPEGSSAGVMARMSDAIRRTPSPQQILDQASRKVATSIAAAGAAVGGALSSIREERDDFGDHSRWSEEPGAKVREGDAQLGHLASKPASSAELPSQGVGGDAADMGRLGTHRAPMPQRTAAAPRKRKSVAVVVACSAGGELPRDPSYQEEDASLLSHLPAQMDHAAAQIFVLIYAPDLKQHPLSAPASNKPVQSTTSSFSNIAHDDARSPGDDLDPVLALAGSAKSSLGDHTSGSASFNTVYAQARSLVENEAMILPFTTSSGHLHILRHLAPEIVYIQDSLTGENGDLVTNISGWVGQVIVLVGADGGHGGLIDSEDETPHEAEAPSKWWKQDDRVGLGKGIDIVDGMRFEEDWWRRVGGRD